MKKSVLLFGLVFVLFSCNSGNKESSSSSSESDDKKEIANTTSSENSYKCLGEFQENYEKLLTKEEMAKVHPIDFDAAKVNLSQGSYGNHEYSWPSDRPELELEVSGMKINMPDDNMMGVSNLSIISGNRDLQSDTSTFNMGYKQLSDEELEMIEKNLSKESEEIQKTGKDMMKVRAKRSWDFVKGTGNSAWYKWNEKYGGELSVLAGKAKFTIKSKVSNDPEQNRIIAVKLAELVLEKCH